MNSNHAFSLAASINERWYRLKILCQCIHIDQFGWIFQMISLFYMYFNLYYYLKSRLASWTNKKHQYQLLHIHNINFDSLIVVLFLMFIKYFCYFTLKYLGYELFFLIYQYFSHGTNILKTVHLWGLFLLIDAG